MWEEIESTHARVYTRHGIQRHVKNQRSTPCIYNGAEEVGNLNSSIHRDSRSLNVLHCWRVNNTISLSNIIFLWRIKDISYKYQVCWFICWKWVKVLLCKGMNQMTLSTTTITTTSTIKTTTFRGCNFLCLQVEMGKRKTHSDGPIRKSQYDSLYWSDAQCSNFSHDFCYMYRSEHHKSMKGHQL